MLVFRSGTGWRFPELVEVTGARLPELVEVPVVGGKLPELVDVFGRLRGVRLRLPRE